LFLLWFGPGNVPAAVLVAFVSAFPIIYNAWTGVKAVKEIWLRSAQVMGADDRRLFRRAERVRQVDAPEYHGRLFLTPTAGEIRIGGAPVKGYGMDRGVVFQDFAQLFPWRTALGNVALGLEMKGLPKAEREAIALEQLRLVKLEKFARSFPHHLSGGMQQRVAIARALAYNPAVLLMDEPFAAFDALTRGDVQRLLADVWRTTRKTVVYVTHNVAEAVYLADRVVVMTPHPGTVKTEVPIRLPRPRDLLSVEFLDYQKELLQLLGQEKRA
jgi:NitT/TauT family transport system ATP-binding protein